LGQGEIDNSQFDQAKIFGVSAAAALYRLTALEKIADNGHYFDELMFMYKEDCDLSYRLYLAGFKAKLAGRALAYHDRSIFGRGETNFKIALNRRNKSQQNKRWSFLNQNIIFLKYWRVQNWREKIAIIWRELKMLLFALLFEQYLLKEVANLWKLRNKIKYYS
jgi:GT2 family glycosyltransferase